MLMAEADAYWAGIDLFRGRDGSPSRYLWFMQYLLVSNATVAINLLGALSLRARFGLSNGIQGPLADNQWHLEVKSWFATMLAHMQNAAVNTATGLVDELKPWKRSPNQTVEYSMCNNQVSNVTLSSVLTLSPCAGQVHNTYHTQLTTPCGYRESRAANT